MSWWFVGESDMSFTRGVVVLMVVLACMVLSESTDFSGQCW